MAYKISDFDGQIHPADSNYLDGDIKDNTGGPNGTKNNRKSNADMHQFFRKVMREAGITANSVPDNEYNGYQFFEAMQKIFDPYKRYNAVVSQTGTNAPVLTMMPGNTIGNIVWTRNAAGIYHGTLTNAFTVGKTQLFCGAVAVGATVGGYAAMFQISASIIEIFTYDTSGNQADGIISGAGAIPIEVRVWR